MFTFYFENHFTLNLASRVNLHTFIQVPLMLTFVCSFVYTWVFPELKESKLRYKHAPLNISTKTVPSLWSIKSEMMHYIIMQSKIPFKFL